jgi:hypothetical protein
MRPKPPPVQFRPNDEWQLQHRYMQVEAMAELLAPANVDRAVAVKPRSRVTVRQRRRA